MDECGGTIDVCRKSSRTSIPRERIYETLRTGSLDEACILRDQMVEADDAYWGALAVADQTGGVKGKEEVNAALRRYEAAKARSLAAGFAYRPVNALAADTRLDDALERLLEVRDRAGKDEIPRARDAEAILATQAFQNNADLLFTRKFPPCLAANILHIFLSRIMRPGFLTHLHPLAGDDEPEILLKQNLSSV